MGQPKEGVLLPDGRRMIEHVIAPLLEVCEKVVILGACRGFSIPSDPRLIALADEVPGMGPLSAMVTLLKSGIDPNGYLLAACDQPFLTPDLLRRLIVEKPTGPRIFGGTTPAKRRGSTITPFPGYYPTCWLSEIERVFLSGERSICNAIQKSGASLIAIEEGEEPLLRNINTPNDLKIL
jgi:molybdopterin-guanine dinucleotide biosynthesis protein A